MQRNVPPRDAPQLDELVLDEAGAGAYDIRA